MKKIKAYLARLVVNDFASMCGNGGGSGCGRWFSEAL